MNTIIFNDKTITQNIAVFFMSRNKTQNFSNDSHIYSCKCNHHEIITMTIPS